MRTGLDEADECRQQKWQVVLQGCAERFQGGQRRAHQLIAAATLGLTKQRHKFGQQPRQARSHVIPQCHCSTATITYKFLKAPSFKHAENLEKCKCTISHQHAGLQTSLLKLVSSDEIIVSAHEERQCPGAKEWFACAAHQPAQRGA